VRRYLLRKLGTYGITFFAAVTIDWVIPHLMPGDPILQLVNRIAIRDKPTFDRIYGQIAKGFRTDLPLWKQYLYFWDSLIHGDLGVSINLFPMKVTTLIADAAPYTLSLLIPSILLSWYVGNKVGAMAARRKALDNTVLPISYALTATPYLWFAMIFAWVFAYVWKVLPGTYGYDPTAIIGWNWASFVNLLKHWILPFMSLFLVSLGGWAIGMRNMIIYELESEYSHYLEALGAPRRLVRKYAFRNAMLPQITGLALSLGAVLAGALVTEIVFAYPGLGSLIYTAILSKDYFVIQGIFLFIILGTLVANFIVDVVYVLVDPRTRIGMQGGAA